jgi:aspartate/methionine/tyrosine aminotransferase
MTAPQTLARPLAARIDALAALTDSIADAPPVPQAVIDAAAGALESGQTHYTDRPGIEPLRARVVEGLRRRFGIELDAGQVTITCGATEARFVAVKQLAAGKAILAPGGGARLAQAAALVGVPLLMTLGEPTDIAILHLTPADNPIVADLLLAAAQGYGWWVIFDTSVAGDRLAHPALNAELAPKVISIGSYSPALPGWRVGWLAGSSAHNRLRAYKQSMTICTTSISQWAALGLEAEA